MYVQPNFDFCDIDSHANSVSYTIAKQSATKMKLKRDNYNCYSFALFKETDRMVLREECFCNVRQRTPQCRCYYDYKNSIE